jgi:hypothetical protein
LDAATYLPVVARAWQGLTTIALQLNGFLTDCPKSFPRSATIDLGTSKLLGSSMLVPYLDRAYLYRIEVSTDNATWQPIVDRTTNTSIGSRLDEFTPVNARYVRLTVVGVSADSTTWVSIQEFAVYPPPTTPPPSSYAVDTFTRTVSNGLGTADTGGSWSVSGSASNYSVSGGTGRMRLASPGASPAAHLLAVSAADVDVTVDSVLDKPATGGGVYAVVVARHVGSNDYRFRMRRLATGSVMLYLTKVVGGVQTSLTSTSVAGLMPAVTDTLRMRFQVRGAGTTTLSAKVWRVGQTEPANWQTTTTDSTAVLQTPGAVGLRALLSDTSTNAPVTASFDNLEAH